MEAKKIKISEIENLDNLVDDSINGTAFAYKYFLKLKSVNYCLCVFDNNIMVAFMPLFENNKSLNQSTMYIPYGGPVLLYSNNNYRKYFIYTRMVISTLIKYIKSHYSESCFSFDTSLTDIIPCVSNGFVPEVRYTYTVDLDRPLEEIYNKFGHDRKRDIRLTKDVNIIMDDNLSKFDIKKALIWEYNYGTKSNYKFVKEYLLQSIKNNRGKCFVAIKDGKVLGGVAVVWDNKTCYIMYSYYEKTTRTVIPIIYYEIIRYLKDKKICKKLDFEGSVFPEIENFNLSFGSIQKLYFNYYYEKDKAKLYEELYIYGDKNEKQY